MWGFSICLLELYTIVCERTRAKAIPVKEAEGKNNNLQTPACLRVAGLKRRHKDGFLQFSST
jgi:hypothetical protein